MSYCYPSLSNLREQKIIQHHFNLNFQLIEEFRLYIKSFITYFISSLCTLKWHWHIHWSLFGFMVIISLLISYNKLCNKQGKFRINSKYNMMMWHIMFFCVKISKNHQDSLQIWNCGGLFYLRSLYSNRLQPCNFDNLKLCTTLQTSVRLCKSVKYFLEESINKIKHQLFQ